MAMLTSTPVETELSRRGFIVATLSSGALIFCGAAKASAATGSAERGFDPNLGPLIRINPDNTIVIAAPSPEIGTGLHTSIPMLIADELGADWNTVSVKQMPVALKRDGEGAVVWAFMPQGGGGSFTLERSRDPARAFAAKARTMLLDAAATRWNVPIGELTATDSEIREKGTRRRARFADLIEEAARRPVPENAALRPDDELRLVGNWTRSKNVEEIVRGEPVFGIDADYPGALHAVVARCPYFEGRVESVDDERALAVPGVRKVIVLDPPPVDEPFTYISAGVAVVAETFWAAKRARDLLSIDWTKGRGGDESSAQYEADFEELLTRPGRQIVRDGDGADVLDSAHRVIDRTYIQPLLAHATMEPQNCIAHFRGDEINIVGPLHSTRNAVDVIARMTGVDPLRIHCKSTRTGGSFGRRLYGDAVCEAVEISRQVGTPVKLTWLREDDMTHDFYRPASAQRITVGLDENGSILGWRHRLAAMTSAYRQTWSTPGEEWGDAVWLDNPPRRMVDNYEVDFHLVETRIPRGPWRAPLPTRNAYVVETFLNELAEEMPLDPLELRLQLLGEARELPYEHFGGPVFDTGRMAECYKKAAREAGWNETPSSSVGRGLAGYFTFGSYCAMIIDAGVSDHGYVQVRKVTAAVDCGQVVNPNGVLAQVEGAIHDGLSAALHQQITVEDGAVVEQNFDGYRMMRIDQAPPIVDIHILPSDEPGNGIGEVGIPPVAPALLEAIYQATGKRIRRLPIADQLST